MCLAVIPPIPIAAEQPLHRKPTLTYALLIALTAIHLGCRIIIGLQSLEWIPSNTLELLIDWFGYTPAKSLPWTWCTSALLHGDLYHLLGNLLPLWMFGVFIEERLGPLRYALLIGIAQPASILGHEILMAEGAGEGWRDVSLIGASGFIMGILGAFVVLFPTARYRCIWALWVLLYVHLGRLTLPAILYIPVFVFWPDLQAVMNGEAALSGIANGAHLGGAALGLLFAMFIRFAPRSQRTIDRKQEQTEQEREDLRQAGHRNFREALDRSAAGAALAILRQSEREGLPLNLSLAERVRLAEGLEREGETYVAGQTYRTLLAGDLLDRDQRLEIALRLAKILFQYERNLEATKELLRSLHQEYQHHPRFSEIGDWIRKVRDFEKNLFKRPK